MLFRTLSCLLALAALPLAPALAQDSPQRVCGTDDVDVEITRANIAAAKAFAKTHHGAQKHGALTYIPIRFKVIGNSDSTAEASAFNVISLVEAINRDFAPYDWRFFLEDVDGTPFDYFYDDGYNSGLSDDGNFVTANRSESAITMYLVRDASTQSETPGIVLGYYSPRQDILVVRTQEVGTDAATATHELGHYFGLPHTFRGWDFETWDGAICSDTNYNSPVQPIISPRGRGIEVELVTRGGGANCAEAGDLFCDTDADYNVGFGFPNCNYQGPVTDRNGDVLTPDEENFMSYFQDCDVYEFSAEQFASVRADRRSDRRDFLRGQADPIVTDTVTGRVVITSPVTAETVETFDAVTLTWEPVEHALYYYVEVSDSRSLTDARSQVQRVVPATQTSVFVDNLEPGDRYYARVTPFNQLTVGRTSERLAFRTGVVSGVSVPEALAGLALSPNPVERGGALTATLHAEVAGDYDVSVLDATGRLVSTRATALAAGSNRLELTAATQLPAGTYAVRVRSARGVSSRRFVVQ